MPNPKCLFFKMSPPPIDEEVQAMAEKVPFVQNCVDCQRRKEEKLEKMCDKEIA